MKTVKIQLQCDYCEKRSRNYFESDKDAVTADGWKQTSTENICPDCQSPRDIPIDEIGNRLQDVFKFKNLVKTANAFKIQPQNMTNLNNGAAGIPIRNLTIALIALVKEMPLKKRRNILKNIDFLLDK
jgi:hypothetical protein